jgi:hypothetical protein
MLGVVAFCAKAAFAMEVSENRLPHRFCISDGSIEFAKVARQIWFDPGLKGGAHTWVFNGAEVLKALNAFCGDTRLDPELLAQIRYVLDSRRGPTATGGFQDQKQLGVALMFLLARNTSRIWDQLTPSERTLIDLNMEAFMYSSAWTTKDGINHTPVGMNGDTNLNRDWNSNYQNGMVGMIIVTAIYWGSDQFEAKLAAYDDAEFIGRLKAHNMANLLATYTNPRRPPGADIQAGLRQLNRGAVYSFHELTERNLAELFGYLVDRTFSRTIACGLDNGAGVNGYGRIAQNCAILPNLAKKGMIMEFNSHDAEGPRSSASYAYDAWYPLNYARLGLQLFGALDRSPRRGAVADGKTTAGSSNTMADAMDRYCLANYARLALQLFSALDRSIWGEAVADGRTTAGSSNTMVDVMDRYYLGTNDLWFKLDPARGGGYLDYEHGQPGGLIEFDSDMKSNYGTDENLEIFNILQREWGAPEVH